MYRTKTAPKLFLYDRYQVKAYQGFEFPRFQFCPVIPDKRRHEKISCWNYSTIRSSECDFTENYDANSATICLNTVVTPVVSTNDQFQYMYKSGFPGMMFKTFGNFPDRVADNTVLAISDNTTNTISIKYVFHLII